MRDLREENLMQDKIPEQDMKTEDTTSVSRVPTVRQDPKKNHVWRENFGMKESRHDPQRETTVDIRSDQSD